MSYTLRGIPNQGNTCYIASLIQCLRRCTERIEPYLSSLWNESDGQMKDVHEVYIRFIESLPQEVSQLFTLEYQDGVKMYHLPLDTNMESMSETIISSPPIICIYRMPILSEMNDFLTLEIDINNITKKYTLVSCISFISHQHYIALIRDSNRWIKCDDSHISICQEKRQPLYMLFYIID